MLIPAKQLALMFDVSSRTISRWVASGKLPNPVIKGRKKYWSKAQVTELMKKC